MKKISILLLTVFLLLSVSLTASAEIYEDGLIDPSDIFTPSQGREICSSIEKIKSDHGVDVFILIMQEWRDIYGNPLPYIDVYAKDSLEGLQAQKGTEGDPGVLLALCIETREWHLQYTDTDDKLPDSHTLSEYFLPEFGENNFYGGVMGFLEGVDSELSFPWLINLGIALVIGVIIGLIAVSVMKGKLKTVRFAENAHGYVREGSFVLDKSRDLYLYSTVTRVAKPKNNSSGGGGGGGSSRSGGGKF